jgi:integrase
MANLKFSKTALLGLEAPEAGKRLTIYDTDVPKLALRMTHAGAKTFYVVKRAGASMAWVKLGAFPEMTVEKARKEAEKVLGEFASGANPAEARRTVRGEPTFTEAFDLFLTGKRKRDGSPLGERTKRDYQDVLRLYLTPIKDKKLSQVDRAVVKAIHKKATAKSAAQADRALAVVSSVFSYMADQEIFSGTNPASRVQKNPAPARDRFAQADELPRLLEAIAQSDQRDYFLLSLLTGARRANVQAMAWRDLDLSGAVWRIGMTKNGTPQNVPLSPEAVVILKARQERAVFSPFVFPGTGKTGHLVEPKTAWATVLRSASLARLLDALKIEGDERAEADALAIGSLAKAERKYHAQAKAVKIDPEHFSMTDLRIHDLRRTLGSWQAKTGASMAIIGKSLNHKTHQATAIYARLDLDPVRQSVNTATAAMMEAAGLKEVATVLPLPGKRGAA